MYWRVLQMKISWLFGIGIWTTLAKRLTRMVVRLLWRLKDWNWKELDETWD
jgi:hypothetical protein